MNKTNEETTAVSVLEPDEALRRAHELLNSLFWLPTLSSAESYARTHDDCDGDRTQKLHVFFSDDGDAWVAVRGEPLGSLRFRVPFIGGGASPRVRTALMLLAEAIRLDNEEHPL